MLLSVLVMGEWQLYRRGGTFKSVGLNYCLGPRCPKQSVVKISGTTNVVGFCFVFNESWMFSNIQDASKTAVVKVLATRYW